MPAKRALFMIDVGSINPEKSADPKKRQTYFLSLTF
jgi:hypothetical protein